MLNKIKFLYCIVCQNFYYANVLYDCTRFPELFDQRKRGECSKNHIKEMVYH